MSQEGEPPAAEHDEDRPRKGNRKRISSKAERPKTKKRTKTGCLTCRRRRIKCGEERPICKNCIKSKRDCAGYNHPSNHTPIAGQSQDEALHSEARPSATQFIHTSAQFPLRTFDDFAGPITKQSGKRYPVPHTSTASVDVPLTLDTGVQSDRHELQLGSTTSSQLPWSLPASGVTDLLPHQHYVADVGDVFEHVPGQRQGHFDGFHTPYDAGVLMTELPNRPLQYHDYPTKAPHSAPLPATEFTVPEMHDSYQTVTDDLYDDPEDPYDVIEDVADHAGQAIFSHGEQDYEVADFPHSYQPYDFMQMQYLDSDFLSLAAMFPHSPLLMESNQTIFAHFLQASGPIMGVFDRIYTKPNSGQRSTPWTDELPRMALQYPAFAHAMLSVGALHWARLHHGSDAAAVEHFSNALEQVKGLLESQELRAHASTLATILLLAYYEVIAGDHSRWSLHVSGAAKLNMEINFADMFRAVIATRKSGGFRQIQYAHEEGMPDGVGPVENSTLCQRLFDDDEWDIDQKTVGILIGQEVNYTTQSQSDCAPSHALSTLSAAEFREFAVSMELFWWHCKQDLFQCMLSGDGPMLPYARWKYCPPRGRIGIAHRAHATVDHLWLILGRLTEFGHRDRARKLQVVAANGGEWRPPPGFLVRPPEAPKQTMSASEGAQSSSKPSTPPQAQAARDTGPPVANERRQRSAKPSQSASQAGPSAPMYGMIPLTNSPAQLSPLYTSTETEPRKDDLPPQTAKAAASASDMAASLQAALQEHSSICAALDHFASKLSDEFNPVDTGDTAATPFGSALSYRSPVIAAMWTFYHVARIICRRSHPHSPPAAMVSAGANAVVTHGDAQQIGKICAGLLAWQNTLSQAEQVDYVVTSALMEAGFAMLFAAVQYQDSAQRSWTIGLFQTLSIHFGSRSSAALASACEATWSRMGEAGRGPPYQRTLISEHEDIRLASNNVKMEGTPLPTASHSNPMQEHESRFVHHDRNLIDRHASTRTFWALGLLSVEEDLQVMHLNNGEPRES